jgi:hypothetical protein
MRGLRLEYVQSGGKRVTTEAALLRFFDALTRANAPPAAKEAEAGRRQEATERALDAAGI